MQNVAISYTVTDTCPVTCALSATSNEPINGLGDGDAAPDWVIVDANNVNLRAERSALGTGRIYTVTTSCTDSGNASSKANVTVSVPLSR